ncbi:MAG: hypothetical protein A2V64_01700 [Bacteroidetes bacterium RBG_13_43_22]|nr:MAG: hypothetical protein A2V64_01700 [Bacteroidetes bacterium RBG_13_43_22]
MVIFRTGIMNLDPAIETISINMMKDDLRSRLVKSNHSLSGSNEKCFIIIKYAVRHLQFTNSLKTNGR